MRLFSTSWQMFNAFETLVIANSSFPELILQIEREEPRDERRRTTANNDSRRYRLDLALNQLAPFSDSRGNIVISHHRRETLTNSTRSS